MKRLTDINWWRKGPFITYIMIIINLLVYVGMMLLFGTTESTRALILAGANYRPLIVNLGEWWRLLTAGFIHIGLEHLAMNMFSLYFVGIELEKILGHWRFLTVYIASILGGSLLSFAFAGANTLSAGASTGVFGLFATYIVLGKVFAYSPYFKSRGETFTVLIGINLFMNLFSGTVDIWGHLGGALYGAVVTFLLATKRGYVQKTSRKLFILIGVIVVSVLLIFIGIQRG